MDKFMKALTSGTLHNDAILKRNRTPYAPLHCRNSASCLQM